MAREDFEGLKDLAKANHAERIAKNASRIDFALTLLTNWGHTARFEKSSTGHIHAWDANDNLYQFWAGTGKILGSEKRGIMNFARLVSKGAVKYAAKNP